MRRFPHTSNLVLNGVHGLRTVLELLMAPIYLSAHRQKRDITGEITMETYRRTLCVPLIDMKYIAVLCGWEGKSSDSVLWREGMRCGAVQVPDGKYLLGDAGFALCDQCLVPYIGVLYHLKEWEIARERGCGVPQNKEGLFNLRHATARNIVERSFGGLKNKWKVLGKARQFKFKTQLRTVAALCVLNDYLVDIKEINTAKSVALENNEYEDEIAEDEAGDGDGEGYVGYWINRRETARATAWRNQMAQDMWDDYCIRRR